jgi:exodeoxyribonuclease III
VRILSWNINSLRVRLDQVHRLIERHDPDVLMLQETKGLPEVLPDIEGWHTHLVGEKAYNGVAVLTKGPARLIRDTMGLKEEARYVHVEYEGVELATVYVPNGREVDHWHYDYKLEWLGELRDYLKQRLAKGAKLAVAGDFNVAPADRDVWNPKAWLGRTHVSPREREAFQGLVELGLTDLGYDEGFTWWNYRTQGFAKNQGLRIDAALTNMTPVSFLVDRDVRAWERPSDHAPLVFDVE